MTSEGSAWRRLSRLLLAGSVAFTLASVSAATCHAESRPQPWLETYRYRLTPKPNFARAALEELIVLGGEGLQYWKDRQLNSEDWDLDYNWTSFEQKLTGVAYSFDTNRFETNFAYHPAAGTLYYLAPRNNRLTVLESLGFAFATSTVWEVIAEFRERVSINDMWVTPLSGLSLGEATAQLGAFFDRGCASDLNRALGFAFGPLQTLHDSIDGVAPLRARSCDELGFDAASEHRFRASVGVAELRAAPGQVYQVTRAKLSTAIVNLPDGDGPRHGWRRFGDGNVSELTLALAYGASDISDALIDARVTLAGAEYRNLQPGAGALRLGDRALFGIVVGTQYSLHRYLPRRPMDRVFLIDAPAVTIRFSGRRRRYGFALAFDAGGTFGGMDALALDDYRRRFGQLGLTVIADQQRYNYVAGVALAPSARLELQGAELGIAGRSERVTAIRALQRYTSTSPNGTATDHELRRRGEAWISVGPRIGPRLTFSVEATERSGDLGDSQRRLNELGAGLSFEAAL